MIPRQRIPVPAASGLPRPRRAPGFPPGLPAAFFAAGGEGNRPGPSAPRPGRSAPEPPPAPAPVNLVDGVPDRSPRRHIWKYVLLAVIFLAWVAFLVYSALAGIQ